MSVEKKCCGGNNASVVLVNAMYKKAAERLRRSVTHAFSIAKVRDRILL